MKWINFVSKFWIIAFKIFQENYFILTLLVITLKIDIINIIYQIGLFAILMSNNFNRINPFLKELMNISLANNKDNLKYSRFLILIKGFIKVYGYQIPEISDNLIKEIIS